jgi:hypothetical protein
MLVARSAFAIVAQALVALMFALQSSTAGKTGAADCP